MKPDHFYPRILALSHMPAAIRVKGMNRLHLECAEAYLAAIRKISAEQAAISCEDGRTISVLVAHIAEWERYIIQSVGDVISGVRRPFILTLKGYRDMDGARHDFDSIDDFNAFQTKQYQNTQWSEIQPLALHTAGALQSIFSQPVLLPFELMEKTAPYDWHIPGGSIMSMPIIWYLWTVVMEHEVVDHARELGLED